MSRWRIAKTFTFECAHQLMHHDGKCKNLHGHSMRGTITLQSDSLEDAGPKVNMVRDFSDLGKILKKLETEYLDHHFLNETLETDSPTSEFIAKWVYDYLKPLIPELISVEIQETCTAAAIYGE